MRYRKDIDGLRALAVIPVILYHAGHPFFSGGFLGVDVFFVISGYLITSIILEEMVQGRFSLWGFYERRIRRILPALFLVASVSIVFAYAWMSPREMKDFSQSIVSLLVFASNVLFCREAGYFDSPGMVKPLLHTWSLAVEEQYYFVIPLLLVFLVRYGRRFLPAALILMFVVSLGLAEWASRAWPTISFYMLPTRFWELMAGSILASFMRRGMVFGAGVTNVLPALGMVLILVSFAGFDRHTIHPGLLTLLPVAGACFVILAGGGRDIGTRILAARPSAGIGKISYSLYLWHYPVLVFLYIYLRESPESDLKTPAMLVIFPLSYLSWRYVEQPFRKKDKIATGTLLKILFVFYAGLALLGMWGASEGLPGRFTPEQRKIFADQVNPSFEMKDMQGRTCHNGSAEDPCIIGAAGRKPDLILLGDSYAGQFIYSLDKALKSRGRSAAVLTQDGCPFVPDFNHRTAPDKQCAKNNAARLAYIKISPARGIMVAGNYQSPLEEEGLVEAGTGSHSRDTILKGYEESVRTLAATGKKISLVYPIPLPHRPFAERAVRYGIDSPETSYDYDYSRIKGAPVAAVFDAVKSANIMRLHPEKILCNETENTCAAFRDGKLLYIDGGHLSVYGTDLMLKNFPQIFK